MKYLVRLFTAVVLLSTVTCQLSAQGISSSGTDYWVGFMPNGDPALGAYAAQMRLFIATGTKNKVSVSIGTSTTSYILAPNEIKDLPLDGRALTSKSETITPDGAVHVTSTNPITLYGYSVWTCTSCIGGSPDGFLGLPITSYGTQYYTVNYPDGVFSGNTHGEFLIVAPYDNTNVTITPKSDTRGGHLAGVPWTFTLSRGQTYLVQSPGNDIGANDLSGTSITTSRPVAVMTGHEISSVPTDWVRSADHFLEMLPPVDKWGTQYFDMPMAGRTACGDFIRIISGEDGNQITYKSNGPNGTYYLNAGDVVDDELVTDPTVYTSVNHKKFIVTQYSYSQGYNGDPGTADPFMVLFTPQQQFEKEMIFRTPTPAKSGTFNNYVTFIARDDSIKKITINGQPLGTGNSQFAGHAQFPNTNPVMGGYRVLLLGGSNVDYVAKGPVPFGAYQYGFSLYEGYGWPTGMAQNIISPDTLPPLVKILDSTCGTYTLRFFEPRRITNGFSFDDTRLAYIALITDAGDARWDTPSYNYSLTPDPGFIVGDSTTVAKLSVVDPTQDAYAAIFTVDRAGNDTVYQYHYYAPKISVTPAPTYDFGAIPVGTDSCMTLTLTNLAAGDFMAESDSIDGIAQGGNFTVSPRRLSPVHAAATTTLSLCFQAVDTGVVSTDTLRLLSQCATYQYLLKGTGITPLIYASDVNFGEVDSGQTLCKQLTLRNPGKATLTITSQDLVTDPNFSIDPNQKFPIVIPPGQSVDVLYCFHPKSWGTFSGHVIFANLNTAKFQHSIKDTSLLTGLALPAGAKLTSYDKTFSIGCTDTLLRDTLYNNFAKGQVIDSIGLAGPDAKYFTLTVPTKSFPFVLDPGMGNENEVPLEIQFHSLLNGYDFTPRHATVVAYAAAPSPQPTLAITAQLVTPRIAFAPSSIDLGYGRIGHSTTSSFTITNSGNAPLTIGSYNVSGADAGAFTLLPLPPYTIAPGAQQIVTITATGSETRTYTAQVQGTSGCENSSLALVAKFYNVGDTSNGTTHPKTYVAVAGGPCGTNQQTAFFVNTGSLDTITVLSATIDATSDWKNPGDFGIPGGFNSANVNPHDTLYIPIRFTPMAHGVRQAALTLNLKGKKVDGTDSLWTETVLLQGTGVGVRRTFAIGAMASTPAAYQALPDHTLAVPIVIDNAIDFNTPDNGTQGAYGYRVDVSWKRDLFQYISVTPPVVASNPVYNPATDMETRTFTLLSSSPLGGQTTLATLNLRVMVSKSDTTAIGLANAVWLDKDSTPLCYAADTTIGATFQLDPVCGTKSIQYMLTNGTIPPIIRDIRPNPAHDFAKIGYSVAAPAVISISIFDVMGNEVRRIADKVAVQPGSYDATLSASDLPSGTYFCRLTDGQTVRTREFVLQR
ncbi:MAG: choice-of-anchor D domain-containing protein [Bacteroidota bacterium]|nr:choice-of-anchor D domain-containing protein [Bacteroidota bacterium]MDP4287731.1 choice-of-anchor D domain-containing protein [Bacteroidota bacterium]